MLHPRFSHLMVHFRLRLHLLQPDWLVSMMAPTHEHCPHNCEGPKDLPSSNQAERGLNIPLAQLLEVLSQHIPGSTAPPTKRSMAVELACWVIVCRLLDGQDCFAAVSHN